MLNETRMDRYATYRILHRENSKGEDSFRAQYRVFLWFWKDIEYDEVWIGPGYDGEDLTRSVPKTYDYYSTAYQAVVWHKDKHEAEKEPKWTVLKRFW